jgi:hypothetical protein
MKIENLQKRDVPFLLLCCQELQLKELQAASFKNYEK